MAVTISGTDGITTPQINAGNIVGEVGFFARSTAPEGWLKANGAAVSRTTFADLFTEIGTTYGAGDGSTTFALPDMRGEFPRGFDDGRGVDSGRAFGTAQGDAIRNITGTYYDTRFNNSVGVHGGGASGAFNDPSQTGSSFRQALESSGNSQRMVFDASRVVPTAGENRPCNVALLACIKF